MSIHSLTNCNGFGSYLTPYIETSPIKVVMTYLGQRWTMNIIQDMMMGYKKYTDFLSLNKGLSSRVLSQRLKELESAGIVKKEIISKDIEYSLTEKGMHLNRVLFQLAVFSFEFHKKDIFTDDPMKEEEFISLIKQMYL